MEIRLNLFSIIATVSARVSLQLSWRRKSSLLKVRARLYDDIEDTDQYAEACEAIPGPKPKITVIVCIKRHHTRMFPTERGDRLGNVLPGTVVENSPNGDICEDKIMRGSFYPWLTVNRSGGS